MKEISYREIVNNPMNSLNREWMLITAGDESSFNTMTASWGHYGSLWGTEGGMPTVTVFIRPQRYTHEFVEREDRFSLTFFNKDYRKALAYLGRVSGRDEDKIAKAGLTPVFMDSVPCFEEAYLTLICRKLYRTQIREEEFLDRMPIDTNYPERDFHTMYIAAVEKVYIQE